jgi:hypothetical protein
MGREDIVEREIAGGRGAVIEMIGNFSPKINETAVLDAQCRSSYDLSYPGPRQALRS